MPRTVLERGKTGNGVAELQQLLTDIGFVTGVDGRFGALTEATVKRFQRSRLLDDDGIVGPKTWAALETAIATQGSKDRLAAAGDIAVLEAERIWKMDIIDPPSAAQIHEFSRKTIDNFIRSSEGCGWSWDTPYQYNHHGREWCTAFVMWCWARGGLALKPHRFTFGMSTWRLDCWARYTAIETVSAGVKPSHVAPRMIIDLDEHSNALDAVFPDGTIPRAGDILLVGDGTPRYGDHGTLVRSFDPITGIFETYEGNATGIGPKGNKREGVIRAMRRVGGSGYAARRVIRPSIADLV